MTIFFTPVPLIILLLTFTITSSSMVSLDGNTFGPISRFDSSNSIDLDRLTSSSTSESRTPLTEFQPRRRARRRRGGRSKKPSTSARIEDDLEGHELGEAQQMIVEEPEKEPSSPLFEEVSAILDDLIDDPPVEKPPSRGDKGALKLRLDINLEVVLELKAKIHGDITLTLLRS
ncbi:hypothetical protein L218DRAFT_947302 [Marasmius fiardii PR-910]|nr:hypothetical protein L218DRAFT_947302 [Marasmius fiardii PR-910]